MGLEGSSPRKVTGAVIDGVASSALQLQLASIHDDLAGEVRLVGDQDVDRAVRHHVDGGVPLDLDVPAERHGGVDDGLQGGAADRASAAPRGGWRRRSSPPSCGGDHGRERSGRARGAARRGRSTAGERDPEQGDVHGDVEALAVGRHLRGALHVAVGPPHGDAFEGDGDALPLGDVDLRGGALERQALEHGVAGRGEVPRGRVRGEVLEPERAPGVHHDLALEPMEALTELRHLEAAVPEGDGALHVAVLAASHHVELRVRVDAAVELRDHALQERHRRVGAEVLGLDRHVDRLRQVEPGRDGGAPGDRAGSLRLQVAVRLIEPRRCDERAVLERDADLAPGEVGVIERQGGKVELRVDARRLVQIGEGDLAAHLARDGALEEGGHRVEREARERHVARDLPGERAGRQGLGRAHGHLRTGAHDLAAGARAGEVHGGGRPVVGDLRLDVDRLHAGRRVLGEQVGALRGQRELRSARRPAEVGDELDVALDRRLAERRRQRVERSLGDRDLRRDRRVPQERPQPARARDQLGQGQGRASPRARREGAVLDPAPSR